MAFETMTIDEAKKLMEDENPTVIDIRDPESFTEGHIEGATHAGDLDMEKFVAEADKEAPLLLYCYHGISSQQAAQYFDNLGFARVYSMDGGYEGWRVSGD